MNIPFGSIPSSITGLAGSGLTGNTLAAPSQTSFADAFAGAIEQVEGAQANAKSAAMDLLAGGKGDVHTVAVIAQRAELSLELFQQVRNKFVSAYQEIMKMPM
jgi:flagellar hook-basal body complex protein FliE